MSLKPALRRALGLVGLEVYGARGGLYFCRAPHAGRAENPLALPKSCTLRFVRGADSAAGRVEVSGGPAAVSPFESSFIRLPMIPAACAEEIRLVRVYEFLYRQDRLSAIREWRRILRPGGTLVVEGLPDFEAIAAAFVASGGGAGTAFDLDAVFLRTHGDPAIATGPDQMIKDVYTRETVHADLSSAGYEDVRIENVRRDSDPSALWMNVVARRPR